MRFVQLSPSLQFFAIKWEVRTHRNYHVTVSMNTDQWAQQPNSVTLTALRVCSRHHCEKEGGWYLSPSWHPLLAANPFWPEAGARAARANAQLLANEVSRTQWPEPRAAISARANSTEAQSSRSVVEGSFEWHFGKHGQALTPVRDLYKAICLAMGHLRFAREFIDP